MEIAIVVSIAFVLDLIFGDPRWLPHPIRFIGLLIDFVEKPLRKIFKGKNQEIFAGILLNLIVISISFMVPFLILYGIDMVNHILRLMVETFFCYQILATKSLKKESMRVYKYVKAEDLPNSRKYLSWIVGRDTKDLTFTQIIKATVETIAENASDGVIAPMLFMIIGGAPLGFLYKGVNTLDSMVGYKNDEYINFGKFSAIVDDVFNFIPARLTGLSFVAGSMVTGLDWKNSYRIFKRDRLNHASPNSANPESACAGALNVQLAGDAYYFGKLYKKKTIGDNNREVNAEDIVKTNKLMYASAVFSLIVFCVIRLVTVIL